MARRANNTAEAGQRSVGAQWGWPVVRTAVGLVLLAAAVLKTQQLASEPVVGSGLLSARWFLIAQVQLEILLGVWLLCGAYARWAWVVTVACFAVFAGVTVHKGLAGEATCGCFGRLSPSPWVTLGIDLAVLAGLLLFRPPAGGPRAAGRVAVGGALALLLALAAGLAAARYEPARLADDGTIVGQDVNVVLEPEHWAGKAFPLLGHVDIGEQLAAGEWTAVLYHHDCPGCRRLLDELSARAEREAERSRLARIALIEVPPYGPSGVRPVGAESEFVLGRLSDSRAWFVSTPTVLELRDGQVVAVRTAGSLRSAGSAGSVPLASVARADGEEHRFGYVEPASVHEVAFTVRNRDDVPLLIRGIHSECECLTVAAGPRRIAPGGSAAVAVRFVAPEQRQANYSKRLMLLTDSRQRPQIALRISATVGVPLEASPNPLELGELIEGECREATVTLFNGGGEPARPIYSTSSLPGCIAVIPRAVIEPGGSLAVPVRIGPWGDGPGGPAAGAFGAGPRRASLSIQTDLPAQPQVSAAVTFRVCDAYRLGRGSVELPTVRAGERLSVTVEVERRNGADGPFVKSAELECGQGLAGAVSVRQEGSRALVRCDLEAGPAGGPISGLLRLALSGRESAVTVPIRGRIVGVSAR